MGPPFLLGIDSAEPILASLQFEALPQRFAFALHSPYMLWIFSKINQNNINQKPLKMLALLLNPANLPFTIALAVMVLMAMLELFSALLGSGLFSFLDPLVADLDLDAAASDGYVSRFLSWIKLGKIPAIILLILFLTFFGLSGIVIQLTSFKISGQLLPSIWACLPAVFIAVLMVRIMGIRLAPLIPGDETEAVSEESFVGRIAIVTIGIARIGKPAQAKLRDIHGRTHYVMVEPDAPEKIFSQGQTILLIGRKGAVFQASDEVPDCLIAD